MRIHLIKTDAYPETSLQEILAFLNSFNGPLQFTEPWPEQVLMAEAQASRRWHFEDDPRMLKRKVAIGEKKPMPKDWRYFFDACVAYRDTWGIENDMVVLLSHQANKANWFSMFDGEGNAFIDCADWSLFTQAPAMYPIAYEVIANVLRTLMQPKMVLPNPIFHEWPRGCVNDLCMRKAEILFKLRTADICSHCLAQLKSKGVDRRVLDQCFSIFEGIRQQLLFRERARGSEQLSEIKLTENRQFRFTQYDNQELQLYPLQKVLYAFYLNHPEGVKLNELSDHRPELVNWYGRFSNASTQAEIDARIADLVDPLGMSFSQKKSSLNNKIKSLLGPRLAPHYCIVGEAGAAFRIDLPRELVAIENIH